MNATLEKFGYPETQIAHYDQWVVLLRPQQATLGALVLAHPGSATSFAELPVGAHNELGVVTGDIERTLKSCFGFEKINYLMLMMVDPHVHFHVLPRYSSERHFAEQAFGDPGWPGPPRLDHATELDSAALGHLAEYLREAWPKP